MNLSFDEIDLFGKKTPSFKLRAVRVEPTHREASVLLIRQQALQVRRPGTGGSGVEARAGARASLVPPLTVIQREHGGCRVGP